jgi:hypothetical protein
MPGVGPASVPPLPTYPVAYETKDYAGLTERGITPQTLHQFGVRYAERLPGGGGPYWVYPVHQDGELVAWRAKGARAGHGAAKYLWVTPKLAPWGMPARTDVLYAGHCIQREKSVCLVAGEPDCWLMHSLGIRAVTFLAGEGKTPAPALDALMAKEPSKVVVIYDNDEPGRRGAVQAVRYLQGHGVPSYAIDLGDAAGMPEKGDLADLWRIVGQDRAVFIDALVNILVRLDIPPEETIHHARTVDGHLPGYDPSSPIGKFKAENRIEDIIGRVTPLRPYGGGRYLRGLCPFHDDHNPSLWVCPQTGRWGCWTEGLWGDVIDFLQRYRALPRMTR